MWISDWEHKPYVLLKTLIWWIDLMSCRNCAGIVKFWRSFFESGCGRGDRSASPAFWVDGRCLRIWKTIHPDLTAISCGGERGRQDIHL